MTLATEPVTAVGPRRPAAFAMRLATDVEAIPPLAPLALRARRAGRAVPTDVLEAFLADLAVEVFLAGVLAADAFLAGALAADAFLAGALAADAFLAGALAAAAFLAG
ncbi:MAG TPA: hypothetical protein ACN46Y_03715, partial [Prochlorococcus sp.]